MNEISSFTSLLFVELKRNLNSISLFDLISIVDRFFFWGEKYNDDDDEQLSLFDNSIDVKEWEYILYYIFILYTHKMKSIAL